MNAAKENAKKCPAPSARYEKAIPCLTKMSLTLLAALLSCFLATGEALKLTRLDVPSVVDPRAEKVALRCEYDLETAALYSVTWYKDNLQFFRYMPGSTPSGQAFPVEGIKVDLNRCDSMQITLLGQADPKDGISLSGTYTCEVSAEAPNFLTAYKDANMTVAILPRRSPVLEGVKPNYEVGDLLEAECTSTPSYPPALLTFILNDKKVNSTVTRVLPYDGASDDGVLSIKRLGLVLRLERTHFPGGSLNLICQSVLPGIDVVRALTTEVTANLAASNQRLAQPPPTYSGCSCLGIHFLMALKLLILTFTV